MVSCGTYVVAIVCAFLTLSSISAIVGGAYCMHTDCPISQTASRLYVIVGIAILILLFITGVYSLYRCRQSQQYTQV